MRRVTFALLCAFVFSLPWEFSIAFESLGSVTRLVGAAAITTGMITLLILGRVRRPRLIGLLALVFTVLNMLSLFWTVAWDDSVQRVITYGQLLGLVWLIWEFAKTIEHQHTLMLAYCCGGFMCVVDLFRNYASGHHQASWGLRYSGLGFDPNDLGLTLAIGIPIAWRLFLTRKRFVAVVACAYIPLALVAILLTASRGAFLASLVALLVVPLTLTRPSLRTFLPALVVFLIAGATVLAVVPQSSWDRIFTIDDQLSQGNLGGRSQIWSAGMKVFQDRMVLGVGAGAFEQSVEPLVGPKASPHNVFLAVLVEQGIIGIFVWTCLMLVCGRTIYRLEKVDRATWAVIALVWLLGAMSLNWQYRKVTWLLFGLLSAQAAAVSTRATGTSQFQYRPLETGIQSRRDRRRRVVSVEA